MSYGPIKVFTGTIASGASTVTSIQISPGFRQVYLACSTMSTAAAMDVYASDNGTTFYQVLERVNTAPVQYQSLTVASSVGSNGQTVPLNIVYPYLQFRTSAVVSGGVTIKLICS